MNALCEPIIWILLCINPNHCELADLQKFPDYDRCQEVRNFQNSLLGYLESQQCWLMDGNYKLTELEEYRKDVEKSNRAWELLYDAHRYTTWDQKGTHILEKLEQLRESIGDSAYFLGQMPQPAPWHKFNQIER